MAKIYNPPNERNSVEYRKLNSQLKEEKEMSVFAVDHLKYRGLERVYGAEKLKNLERLISQSKDVVFLDANLKLKNNKI